MASFFRATRPATSNPSEATLLASSSAVSSNERHTPGSSNSGRSADQEFHAEQRLAAAGATAHQGGPTSRQTAKGNFIEPVDAGGAFGQSV